MTEHLLVGLALILILGVAAQVIGWLTRFPSIVFLIVAGLIAGPVFHWINADEIFGNLFEPFISFSVAIILFEGSLSLKISEIRHVAPVVIKLTTLGVMLTWAVASLGAIWLLDIPVRTSVLLGALLVISGPTVIMPLLRHLRLRGDIGSILKWEGILIDPIGAGLALLVFGAILASGPGAAIEEGIVALALMVPTGIILGGLGALAAILLMRRYLIPDFLHIPVVLSLVIGTYMLAGLVQQDAGLFSAVIMGGVLANQKQVNIQQIVTFKETLGLILVSLVFITLSSVIDIARFLPLLGAVLILCLLLVGIARPLSVIIASWGSKLDWKDKVLMSSVAPRGIVAASIASVFAFRLSENGIEGSEDFVALTFAVILVTVIYSSIASTVATRFLGISETNPQGVIFIGGQIWVRDIATVLKKTGIQVLIIDESKANISYARRKGIPAIFANAVSPDVLDDVDLGDYGYALSMTSDDNINHLIALQFGREFGSGNTFLLSPLSDDSKKNTVTLPGRVLFLEDADFDNLNDLYLEGAKVKMLALDEKHNLESIKKKYPHIVPIMALSESKQVTVIATDTKLDAKTGTQLIALVPPSKD